MNYEELRKQVEQESVQLWDCRTSDEYSGVRLAARRGGHIQMPSILNGVLHLIVKII